MNTDPFVEFKDWYTLRVSTFKGDPSFMALATGWDRVSARMVLLKSIDNGFVFYTNYRSRKGIQIDESPYGALLFYWPELKRQIRIEGKIEKILPKESDNYFQTRPYISRLGAHASLQSAPLDSHRTLITKVIRLIFKYPIYVPLPENWGGYRLIPEMFEFWSEGNFRLHTRTSYILTDGIWGQSLLYP